MRDVWRKIDLYVLSLGLLFAFILVMTVEFPNGVLDLNHLSAWGRFFGCNIFPTIILVFLIYAVFAYFRFDFDLKGATDIPFQVTKVESINYEHLTFLATYVIPLISFNFSSDRQLIGNRENIILISKCKIVENQKLSYIKLDDRIYYVKGVV
jgi:hypothetical protein